MNNLLFLDNDAAERFRAFGLGHIDSATAVVAGGPGGGTVTVAVVRDGKGLTVEVARRPTETPAAPAPVLAPRP